MNNFCKILLLIFLISFTTGKGLAQFRQNIRPKNDSLKIVFDHTVRNSLHFNSKFDHHPFFCRQEEKIYQHTGVNIKFRLGNYDYTQWMERKPNSFFNVKY